MNNLKRRKKMNTKCCDGFWIKSENNFVWNAGRDREREGNVWHETEEEKIKCKQQLWIGKRKNENRERERK